jgi:hypothetical protein
LLAFVDFRDPYHSLLRAPLERLSAARPFKRQSKTTPRLSGWASVPE